MSNSGFKQGRLGIGKDPIFPLDVNGHTRIDGDLVLHGTIADSDGNPIKFGNAGILSKARDKNDANSGYFVGVNYGNTNEFFDVNNAVETNDVSKVALFINGDLNLKGSASRIKIDGVDARFSNWKNTATGNDDDSTSFIYRRSKMAIGLNSIITQSIASDNDFNDLSNVALDISGDVNIRSNGTLLFDGVKIETNPTIQPIQASTDSAPNWGDNDPVQKIDGDVSISGIINKDNATANYFLKVNADGNAMEWDEVVIPANEGKWTGDTDISFNGNVGIGADTPSDRLHLYKEDADTYLTIQNKRTTTNTTQYLSGIKFKTSSGDKTDEQIASRIDSGWLPSEDGVNQSWIKFLTNGTNFTDDLVIKGGNVGIGTASPDKTLHLKSNGCVLNMETTQGNVPERLCYISFRDSDANNSGEFAWIGDGSGTQNVFYIYSSRGDPIVLDNANVGIGTTSPQTELSVKGSEDGGISIIRSSDNYHWRIFNSDSNTLTFQGRNDDNNMSIRTNCDDLLCLRDNGSVGIGTASPDVKLHIHTTPNVANYDVPQVLITTDPHNTYNQYASLELRGGYIGNTVQYGVGIRTTHGWNKDRRNYGDFNIYTTDSDNGNARTDRLTVTSEGNVGIGTTRASATLDVRGNANFHTYTMLVSEFGTNAGIIKFINWIKDINDHVLWNEGGDYRIRVDGSLTTLYNNTYEVEPANNPLPDTYDYTSIESGVYFYATWALPTQDVLNKILALIPSSVTFEDGNVGIGTSSPVAKLDFGDSGGDIRIARDAGSQNNQKIGRSDPNGNWYCYINFIDENSGGNWNDDAISFFTHKHLNGVSEKMRITGGGNVGIGTTSPQTIFNISKLHDPRLRITGTNDDDTAGIELLENTNSQTRFGAGIIYNGDNNRLEIKMYDNNTLKEAISVIRNNCYVGIGTTSPDAPLHVYSSSSGSFTINNRYQIGNSSEPWGDTGSGGGGNLSLIVEGRSWFKDYTFHTSDSRIKDNIENVPDNLALEMVRNIPCRYYEYKDKLSRGNKKTIGFIAQEVKDVLPMAVVTEQTSIIPNEMRILTDISWNDATLYTDLSDCSGIKYRFYVSNDPSGNETMKEVVGNNDNSFTFDQSWNHVFCYGKEVDDFHTLDKQKLFALNFSATQELDKKVIALENENKYLKEKIEAIEKRLAYLGF